MEDKTPPVCDYEGSDYQSRFWEQGGRAYEDAVEAVALKRLLPPGGQWLLELGAGAGRNTPRYAGFKHVVLVDYSSTQLQQAQEKLGPSGTDEQYVYVAADIYKLPFAPRGFDAATMIRTLHHMAEPQRALEQVRFALRPGATFILEYANKRNLKSMLRYALRQQDWSPYSREPVEFAQLNYDFHPEAVREWLKQTGFTIQRQLTVSHYRMEFFKRYFPLKLLVAMDSFAQLSGDWWQLSPSVFTRASAGSDARAPESTPESAWQLFRCPDCGGSPLRPVENGLLCPACGRLWPRTDGIYDFREKA
jgi:ubiquinone/menaquinone biosynthesis C-methylase UbiE